MATANGKGTIRGIMFPPKSEELDDFDEMKHIALSKEGMEYRDMNACRKCLIEHHGFPKEFVRNMASHKNIVFCEHEFRVIVDDDKEKLKNLKIPFEVRPVPKECPYYAEHVVHNANVDEKEKLMTRMKIAFDYGLISFFRWGWYELMKKHRSK